MALPLLDAMTPAFARVAPKPVHRFQTFYVPNGMAMEYWLPKTDRRRLRAHADPGAAGAVPEPDARAVRAQGELELHPRRRVRIVSDRHDARRAERSRDHRRRLDGSAARPALRQRDAGGLARAGDGSGQQRRRLHRQPELRLHAHALVAQQDAAAADGVQPARRVREAVRRQRQHRSRGARGAPAPAQEHSRFGQREAGEPQAIARARRIRPRSTSTPSRSATSSGASRRPRSSATSICRRWTSRRACRRSSRITWR